MSTSHSKAAKKFLKNQDYAEWHDKTFWGVREKREHMAYEVPEWEQLRRKASEIKRHSLTNIDKYLAMFADAADRNGTIVHWAGDAEDFNEIVYGILKDNGVKKLVKSKSMLTEECEMNPYLEERGIEVVETDLGERILQLAHQKPSHIVMPAIHLTHDDVGELFERELGTEPGNHDPTYLTYMARLSLRNEFLTADAGLTGANFGIAETGDIVVCTNEGNADMSTSIPKLHIAAIGLEKIIPDYDSLAVFTRLLARSATGQPSTTFTSHFRKARPGAKPMHIVIVDNGRSRWLGDADHWETLKCIRCGSCMNTCPVYRWSGGYSYSFFIPGPLGINLGMLHNPEKYFGNVSACTLCHSCQCTCPVKVDLADQIYKWRQDLNEIGVANKEKRAMCRGMEFVFGHKAIYNSLTQMARMANYLPPFLLNNGMNPWAYGHKMMKFPAHPYHRQVVIDEKRLEKERRRLARLIERNRKTLEKKKTRLERNQAAIDRKMGSLQEKVELEKSKLQDKLNRLQEKLEMQAIKGKEQLEKDRIKFEKKTENLLSKRERLLEDWERDCEKYTLKPESDEHKK